MITEEQKIWIEKAISMELTTLQVKKKLKESGYTRKKIDEIIEYFEKEVGETTKEEEFNKEEEEEFEEKVKIYNEDPSKLDYFDRKEVKKWLKKVKKQITMLDVIIKGLKLEVVELNKRFGDKNKELEIELEDIRKETIDVIIKAKSILIIEHPYIKGEEVTKENLKDVGLDELVKLIEIGKEELELIVNGKV